MTTDDRYLLWDAAYVLGALSAAERREFEDHMAACAECRAAVADLAVVPGLLARVPAPEVLAGRQQPADLPAPPASLMPDLATEVSPLASIDAKRRGGAARHGNGRWRWYAVAAVAAALVFGAGAGWAVHRPQGARSVLSAAGGRLAFSAVVPSTITAVVDVVPTADGTEFKVECQYAQRTPSTGGPPVSEDDYDIWVVDRTGHATLGKTWTAKTGKVMHPSAASELPLSQVAAVEIRVSHGGPTLLRADLR